MNTSWKHQIDGLDLIRRQPATMLAYDMGTGKSKIIVDAVIELELQRTLIVCPKSVLTVWQHEFTKWAGNAVDVIVPATGTVSKRATAAKLALSIADVSDRQAVLVVNYDSIWRTEMARLISGMQWDMIVCDESHRIKSHRTIASCYLSRIAPLARRRVCLTGTPMAHSPLDVFGQYRFLDPTIYGKSFTRFRDAYAIMGGYRPQGAPRGVQIVGFRNMNDLHERFYSIAKRVEKTDVLELPEVVNEQRRVTLCPRARKIYHQLKRDLIAEVESGVVTATNALAKLLRLQQITSGYAQTEDGRQEGIDQGKLNALCDVFGEIGPNTPLVVFVRFRHDLDVVISAAIGQERKAYELSGRRNELAAWQASTDGDVLAVQIQAGGVGVDLTRAHYCVYYSVGFSLGDYVQSLARLHRPGQTRSVTYIHLIAENTVDEKVYAALKKRAQIIETVLATIRGEPCPTH